MSDEVLLEDSPIALYLAQVAKKSKKGTPLKAFKVEKVDLKELEPEPVPCPQKSDPLPVQSSSHVAPSPYFGASHLLGPECEREDSKYALICEISSKVIERGGLAESPLLSSLRDLQLPSYANNSLTINRRISIVAIAILLIQCAVPLCGLLFSTPFAFTLVMILLPISGYFLRILYQEHTYFSCLQDILTQSAAIGEMAAEWVGKLRSTIQVIQEVELVSRGYRLTQQLSPIARLERNAKNTRCQLLRAASRSSLSNFHRTMRQILQQDSGIIYDDLSDVLVDLDASSEAKETTIALLKSSHQAAIIVFTRYLEFLVQNELSVQYEAEGTHERPLRSWLIHRLPSLREIQLCQYRLSSIVSCLRVETSRLEESMALQIPWVSSATPLASKTRAMPKADVRSSLFDHLSRLQSSLQTNLARISLCKDHLQNMDQPDAEIKPILNELAQVFGKVQEDLSLQPELVSGVANALNRLTREVEGQGNAGFMQSDVSDATRPARQYGEFESAESSAPGTGNGLELDDTPTTGTDKVEKVYEAETGAEEEEEVPRSKLSREERIALAKQEREAARVREDALMAKLNFVMELKDVLQSRSAPQQDQL